MPRAALRPSAMAQTTSDWPRRMSPAANTPGTRRHVIRVGGHVAARVQLHAELFDHAVLHGPEEAHGQQHQVGVNA